MHLVKANTGLHQDQIKKAFLSFCCVLLWFINVQQMQQITHTIVYYLLKKNRDKSLVHRTCRHDPHYCKNADTTSRQLRLLSHDTFTEHPASNPARLSDHTLNSSNQRLRASAYIIKCRAETRIQGLLCIYCFSTGSDKYSKACHCGYYGHKCSLNFKIT